MVMVTVVMEVVALLFVVTAMVMILLMMISIVMMVAIVMVMFIIVVMTVCGDRDKVYVGCDGTGSWYSIGDCGKCWGDDCGSSNTDEWCCGRGGDSVVAKFTHMSHLICFLITSYHPGLYISTRLLTVSYFYLHTVMNEVILQESKPRSDSWCTASQGCEVSWFSCSFFPSIVLLENHKCLN